MNGRKMMMLVLGALVAALAITTVLAGPRASASHILVGTKKQAEDLKERIANGEDFGDVAKRYSTCPSGKKGGSLGQFGPGQMVKEFNDVVFSEEVGVVHGPVKTQFGYHLILITDRND